MQPTVHVWPIKHQHTNAGYQGSERVLRLKRSQGEWPITWNQTAWAEVVPSWGQAN